MIEELGKEIQRRREMLGYTQKDVAEITGITDTTIRRIEKGQAGVAIGNWIKVIDLLGLEMIILPKRKQDETGNSI